MDSILVVNAGSSSVKFQVFIVEDGRGLKCHLKGQVEGIGGRPQLRAWVGETEAPVKRIYAADKLRDIPSALQTAGAWLRDEQGIVPSAIGHRVVHGGPDYGVPVIVDKYVLDRLEQLACLAPLHQPHNLACIRSLLARSEKVPQVACFDTAFHRAHGPLADRYALPERFYSGGVRRYGFHGLSYEYIAMRLRDIAPELANERIIVAHLGSGASMCALRNGRSVESSMGFTALDGLPMGTRPGQLDPGIILHLIIEKGMPAEVVQDLLYRDCGLKGLSGLSNDVRDLESCAEPRAKLALDYFVYRVGLEAGRLAAALGGLDAFVFTAGIGENSVSIRAGIGEQLAWLNAVIDPVKNAEHAHLISTDNSSVELRVIPTNEELMIAQHTLSLLWSTRVTQSARERLQ